jgi:hypothetical protein
MSGSELHDDQPVAEHVMFIALDDHFSANIASRSTCLTSHMAAANTLALAVWS